MLHSGRNIRCAHTGIRHHGAAYIFDRAGDTPTRPSPRIDCEEQEQCE